MCGGCPGGRVGDWLELVVRSRTQREVVARIADSRSARVRATANGWTASTPTGRTIVADSLTAMWAAVESLGAPEPDWSSMSLPAGFDEPAPLADRRRPVTVVARDLPDARNRVATYLAAPHCHSQRVQRVDFPTAEPPWCAPSRRRPSRHSYSAGWRRMGTAADAPWKPSSNNHTAPSE
ncbi:hypothetical protein P9209_00820 [Prescottella defluvii]|nr:hypothetical protein P9209_00820 [Prescottella defluvii]